MDRGGWLWAPAVLAALPPAIQTCGGKHRGCGCGRASTSGRRPRRGRAPGNEPVQPEEARARLAELLGADAEPRPQQADYAAAVAAAFAPRDRPGPAPRGARRGRDRGRQDAWLHRAGKPVGREEPGLGVDLDLYPQPADPDRRRTRPALPRPGAEAPPRRRPQGAREFPLPAELRGRAASRR